MLLTQFIDSHIRNEINLFLVVPEILECCAIYGCQAFNTYIIEKLHFKTYDIDILVTNQHNISNITEIIGSKLIQWLNNKLGLELSRLFPNTLFNLTKTSNHLNIKNTVKIFVGNKPLIDISECDKIDYYYNKLYPDYYVSDGYKVKSFEWLIMNLINILKDRTVYNNHIWDKCKQRSQRILFILNHKPYTNLLNYKISKEFGKEIKFLKKLINYKGDYYYSNSMYESKCMELSEIEHQYIQLNLNICKKRDKLILQKSKLVVQNEQLQSKIETNNIQYIKLNSILKEKIQSLEVELEINLKKSNPTKLLMERLKFKISSIDRKNKILSANNLQLLADNQKYKDKYIKLKEKYSTVNLNKLVSTVESSYKQHIHTTFSSMNDLIKQLELQITKLNLKLIKLSNYIYKSEKYSKIVSQQDNELQKKEKELQKKDKEIAAIKMSEKTTKLFCKKKIVECSKLSVEFDETKKYIQSYSTDFIDFIQNSLKSNPELDVKISQKIEDYKRQLHIILS